MVQFSYGSYYFLMFSRNWPLFILKLNSSVSVVTMLWSSRRRYRSSNRKATILVFSEVSILSLGPTKLPLQRIMEVVRPRTIERGVKLADHLNLVSRLRTCGAIFPLSQKLWKAWYFIQHRDACTRPVFRYFTPLSPRNFCAPPLFVRIQLCSVKFPSTVNQFKNTCNSTRKMIFFLLWY